MSLDSAFTETLEPLIQRVEAAARGVADRAEHASRIDTSGLPTGKAAFTIRELSKLLQMDPDTLRQFFHAGQLQGRQLGNRILVWRWSVLEFMGLQARQEKKSAPGKARLGS